MSGEPGMTVKKRVKNEMIYIRCDEELKTRMKILFAMSGEKTYADFLEKLLKLYEVLMKKYGCKKMDEILDYVSVEPVIVD